MTVAHLTMNDVMKRALNNFITLMCITSCSLLLISATKKKAASWDEGKWGDEPHESKKKVKKRNRMTTEQATKIKKNCTPEELRLVRTIMSLERTLDSIDDKIASIRARFEGNEITYYAFFYASRPYLERRAEINNKLAELKVKLRMSRKAIKEGHKEIKKNRG